MYIKQLRLDSRNLSLEELERYSWLFGGALTNELAGRLIDEAGEIESLQMELNEAEERVEDKESEQDRAADAFEEIASFLGDSKTYTPDDLATAARAVRAFDSAAAFGLVKLSKALETLGEAAC